MHHLESSVHVYAILIDDRVIINDQSTYVYYIKSSSCSLGPSKDADVPAASASLKTDVWVVWAKEEGRRESLLQRMPYLGVCDTPPHLPSPGLVCVCVCVCVAGWGDLCYFYIRDSFKHAPLYQLHTVKGKGYSVICF
jgi:hypothetical protein